MALWRFKSCIKCSRDMVQEDAGDWTCVQCGHIRYVNPPVVASAEVNGNGYRDEAEDGPGADGRRRRSTRDINSRINARSMSEERWRARNHKIIEYLDQGWTVSEIADTTTLGPRQVRAIRERWAELRALAEAWFPWRLVLQHAILG